MFGSQLSAIVRGVNQLDIATRGRPFVNLQYPVVNLAKLHPLDKNVDGFDGRMAAMHLSI